MPKNTYVCSKVLVGQLVQCLVLVNDVPGCQRLGIENGRDDELLDFDTLAVEGDVVRERSLKGDVWRGAWDVQCEAVQGSAKQCKQSKAVR
jgi:hypothetical protein